MSPPLALIKTARMTGVLERPCVEQLEPSGGRASATTSLVEVAPARDLGPSAEAGYRRRIVCPRPLAPEQGSEQVTHLARARIPGGVSH